MITRGELKTSILTILNKDSGYQGFQTDEKINSAIEDCLRYVASKMFMAGEGWFSDIETLTMPASSFTADLPAGTAIVNAVRYLINDRYVDLEYDDQSRANLVKDATEKQQYPYSYRIINDNKLYFNPAPSQAGADQIQIETTKYPTALASDAEVINTQFNYGLLEYIKWRSCSLLMSSTGNPNAEWLRYEGQWFDVMNSLVSKRNRKTTYIREFDSV